MIVSTCPKKINDDAFDAGLRVPEDLCCADWADRYFMLPPEASNTSGKWTTTTLQRAILNAFGNDAIQRVDFFKPARIGGTKMAIAANAYFNVHLKRNVGFYQPTKSDSDDFVKTEVEPTLQAMDFWHDMLLDQQKGSEGNTLSLKKFMGCNSYFRGGHGGNSYRRITLDAVILDELDAFNPEIAGEGSPTTLSWTRVKNSVFSKQIQLSSPTVKNRSLIEKSANKADDILNYHVQCPHCADHIPLIWTGKKGGFGLQWQDRDPDTVHYISQCCGATWENADLPDAMEAGFWKGDKGWRTVDGLSWTLNGKPATPPRHIAFRTSALYSVFSDWSEIVADWYSVVGDSNKQKAFHNTVLGLTWDQDNGESVTPELIGDITPVDDLSSVIAITAGIDVQPDRLELQFLGHAANKDVFVLGYEVYRGDADEDQVYSDMWDDLRTRKFQCGDREIGCALGLIDTQGANTAQVHRVLQGIRKVARHRLVGINGNGMQWDRVSKKISFSDNDKDKPFINVATNTLKRDIFSLIQRHNEDDKAIRIWSGANLPDDYAKQMTSEQLDLRKQSNGSMREVYVHDPKRGRNECLDTFVYGLAAKYYAQKHGDYGLKQAFAGL